MDQIEKIRTSSATDSASSDSEILPRESVFSLSGYTNLSEALKFIASEATPEYALFVDIPLKWGQRILERLEKDDGKIFGRKYRYTWNSHERTLRLSMPSPIHEAVTSWYIDMMLRWVSNGSITIAEAEEIEPLSNTPFTMPAFPYQQSTKIPDVAVTPDDGQSLPSFVIEVGWTEPMTALQADMELLLRGSEGLIQRGLVIKWYLQRRTGTVRGTACLWALDAYGRLTKQQEEWASGAQPHSRPVVAGVFGRDA
ncbi:uncharacterized protein N7515_002442 [Penicillium bovifimosum]|uniref:Uncharacterized protein n=1 Tax=Penicillium bovifimosum TaxID=126998 RepID=A0A9W9L841_9EURO|nr:uncharacterized protein N7515_002442 [Penicillium bovifimosum]KAJ5143655.1 hypothetical protein N7515_002442 [Penicillium bovifimosum]